ncbi:conserved hypothetical protein [Echinococcus multilocularis]|uniref:Secreted protein n=2 Tax=Echinococcus TaxID=6209 RepID=A0A068WW31_ECHGR|nr:conserved hypothetical protein [Echinococcus multilocularis]CDS21905.1 hypothetical protein EgrG_000076000 [Echinococcus granulosus]
MISRTALLCLTFIGICIHWSHGAEAASLEPARGSGVCSLVRRRLILEIARLMNAYEMCVEGGSDALLRRKRAPEMLWDIE